MFLLTRSALATAQALALSFIVGACASAPQPGLEDSVREVAPAQAVPMSDEGF